MTTNQSTGTTAPTTSEISRQANMLADSFREAAGIQDRKALERAWATHLDTGCMDCTTCADYEARIYTITAMDLFEQMSDWEGAPPAYLRRYSLADLTEAVVQFTDMATTGHIWISVDLFALQAIAVGAARDYRNATGEWPA